MVGAGCAMLALLVSTGTVVSSLSPLVLTPRHCQTPKHRHISFYTPRGTPLSLSKDWIKDAIGDEFNESEGSAAPSPSSLKEGLSGFAVDEELGFVAIISAPSEVSSHGQDQRWVYAVVSPQDKTQIMSAEALTLIQLAGGIDVGAAVLPPEALARLARDELEDDDDDDEERRLIDRATLVGVEAVPKATSSSGRSSSETGKDAAAAVTSSPERDAKIDSDAPRLQGSIAKLPGLDRATVDAVRGALRVHADDSGEIDRERFTKVLDFLRRGLAAGVDDLGGVNFVMTLNLGGDSSEGLVRVRAPSAFLALGLAMRYSALVRIVPECLDGGDSKEESDNILMGGGCGVDELLERFPAFRPMQELLEDAQTVDGFISHMFYKESAPKAFE